MKISVVTPSFNQAQFIERTIESVLKQSYQDFTYLICDGGSTDHTVEILEAYHRKYPQLSYISEPDRGQTHAVNKGILATTGDIIAWINSDDVYLPDTFAKVVQAFTDNPEALLVYGNGCHIDEHDQFLNDYPVEPWNYQRLFQDCFLCQPAVFFKRSLVTEVGLLDESFQYSMDYEYWLRCAKKTSPKTVFVYVPEVLAHSRFYATNKTLSNRPRVFYESSLALKMHGGRVSDPLILGHTIIMVDVQESTKNNKIPSRYNLIFFWNFLQTNLQIHWLWRQIPSPWAMGKLLKLFIKCCTFMSRPQVPK